ncbi:hypothetical protein PO587_02940 [Streptomyces gilvifuscus]|uniref:Uncharacterized protein n=1 Tax=Streptomyces gilvifuscus TaxID=1550617 RepID=A0ABT5FLN1_9ACTN|nr:hypothetical protein [Streptomyces gilvifuscus]MDC2953408.1 hypothetical protein [Streptomyces gilvifuscus]
MGVKKILTIKFEIEVNEKVTRYSRLENTYVKVIMAAKEAAAASMPTDSIDQITAHARWEYRHWDPEPLIISYKNGEVAQIEDIDEEDLVIDED